MLGTLQHDHCLDMGISGMNARMNDLGQPIGAALPDWQGAAPPPPSVCVGRFCRLEPVDVARHADDLFAGFSLDTDARNWTYLGYGPFVDVDEFRQWMTAACLGDDPQFHAIIDLETGKAVGVASYLRIDPKGGVIEVGNIHYSPLLQRRPAATEAMYLLMRRVFDELGYRRYEWKCDSHNAPSRGAAARLGFSYDGFFPQAVVTKGRNRDTTWFSILDSEWPMRRDAFEAWLDPNNFGADGAQKQSLAAFMPPARSSDNLMKFI